MMKVFCSNVPVAASSEAPKFQSECDQVDWQFLEWTLNACDCFENQDAAFLFNPRLDGTHTVQTLFSRGRRSVSNNELLWLNNGSVRTIDTNSTTKLHRYKGTPERRKQQWFSGTKVGTLWLDSANSTNNLHLFVYLVFNKQIRY